ncbi:uncharacterized protein [Nicotiana sylvestris]|uniref:uncharacterized protein n=1 Tax=Nicotiana sylvestris TaxID=4096 RepID=UPI00388C8163
MDNHEEHNAQDIANEEEKSENEGEFGDEKESDTDDKIGEQVNDSVKVEIYSKEDDNYESGEVGKKPRKTPMKETKSVVPTGKEVAPPSRNPLTRSKRKDVDEQIIKESRSSKKPRKKASIVDPVVELDGENESALPAKSSTQKRKVAKATNTATPSARVSGGKMKEYDNYH